MWTRCAVDPNPELVTRARLESDLDEFGVWAEQVIASDDPEWQTDTPVPYLVTWAVSGSYGQALVEIVAPGPVSLWDLVDLDDPSVIRVPGAGAPGEPGEPGPPGAEGQPGAGRPCRARGCCRAATGATVPRDRRAPRAAPDPRAAPAIPGRKASKGSRARLGPAGLTYRGSWSAATAYVLSDLVTYLGSGYYCEAAVGPSATSHRLTPATGICSCCRVRPGRRARPAARAHGGHRRPGARWGGGPDR